MTSEGLGRYLKVTLQTHAGGQVDPPNLRRRKARTTIVESGNFVILFFISPLIPFWLMTSKAGLEFLSMVHKYHGDNLQQNFPVDPNRTKNNTSL